ncbi:helix-turn-helix transcriptional regulator [Gordonia amicalis]|uniref:helix-turn-helix transcriptional regulator n=2 Tax=Gordonia amicalis TaxID=89053 RepID=UPI0028709B3E|nr:helix-turn-helix transcriptional regulator [Gordonia amicalis]
MGACFRLVVVGRDVNKREDCGNAPQSVGIDPTERGAHMPRAGVHGFSAAALRRTMTRAGVSTDELAELIGVARQTVSAWLNNVTVPSPGSLAKVADVLEVEVAEFTPSAVGDPSLVDLRVRAGLSQTAAAVALGVSRTVLGVVERGQRRELPAPLADGMASVYASTPADVYAAWEVTLATRRQVLEARAAARRRRK